MLDRQILVKKICDVLQYEHSISAAWLFGSAHRGEMRTESDIDLALLPADGAKTLSPETVQNVISKLTAITGYPVDPGIVGSQNLVYSHEAICRGERIFTRDHIVAENAEMLLLSQYAQFNEDRKEVINAYRA